MSCWNPWHGCHKYSEGCKNCYVYRMDAFYGRDSHIISKNVSFSLPVARKKDGSYKLSGGQIVYTCLSSDFFIEEADVWRDEIWAMIEERKDLRFYMITKRAERIAHCLPKNWGNGYPNVCICCTIENQKATDVRLPIFKKLPICHKQIICEPLLEEIHLPELSADWIEAVSAGGESGASARECNYDWVLSLRQQCRQAGVNFYFHQTGARLRKEKRLYQIPRSLQHRQAKKAKIDLEYQTVWK